MRQLRRSTDASAFVEGLRRGDDAAFRHLDTRYRAPVQRYLTTALDDEEEARDATQLVFMRVFQAAPRYVSGRSFEAWLFRIARNVAIDAQRRRRPASPHDPLALDRHREAGRLSGGDGPEWGAADDVHAAIARLPLVQRQVLELRYLYGLPTREIGGALGRTDDSVRHVEQRAMCALRTGLAAVSAVAGTLVALLDGLSAVPMPA